MKCAMIGETSLLEIIAMLIMTKNKNDTASCRIREVKTNPFSKRQIASVSKVVIAAPPIPAAPQSKVEESQHRIGFPMKTLL